MHKQGDPSATASIQSKRAHEEEADDDDANPSASQSMHSSKVPACSISLLWLLCRDVSNSLYMIQKTTTKTQYICSMSRLILLLMALPDKTATSTPSAIWVIKKYTF